MSNLPAIRKIARIHDKAKNTYLEAVEFPVSESVVDRVELAPSIIANPSRLGDELRDAGAILPKDPDTLKRILDTVGKSDPPETWVYEAQTGWISDQKAFVLTGGALGKAETKIIGVNRGKATTELSGHLSDQGTWDAWRDTVATLAGHSSLLMFTICVALGAPLLAVVNRQSFTINLCGRTRLGKSVATLVAASVIGTAQDADLMTWNITDARLEQRLAEFNDCLFAIDDLMAMRAKDKDKYQRIRDLAYKITQGWATARYDTYTAAGEGAHRGWRSIALTSSEKSIRDLAQAVKLQRQHGEALRLIDVPAVGDGQDHIFDRHPKEVKGTLFEAWKKTMFARLADACEQNHGAAWRKYIESLIAEREGLKEYIEKRISFFEQAACDEYDGDIARDVARKFGVIYAGGMLGIRCGLLPWERKHVTAAVKKAYRRARDLLPDDGVSLRLGIAALRAKLRELPRISMPPSEDDKKLSYDELDGFRQRQSKANRYVIKGDCFRRVFSNTEQQALVIDWLITKERITLSAPQTNSGPSERAPKGQFEWPDGERRRSFEIFWPIKPKKKEEKKKTKAKSKKSSITKKAK